jgi:DNA polymerase-3 subunit gamma/tau
VAPAAAAPAQPGADLAELWQQILAGLELPSTRMLLSQQAVLSRLDQQRAVVQVASNWMAMVQSRLPLLEKAVAAALGGNRQVMLEAGGAPPPAPQAPVPSPVPSPPVAAKPSPPPQPAPTPAAVPAPQELAAAQPAPPTQPPLPSQPALIDDQAKRLAAFFNGEVVTLDGPLLELEPTPPDHQAACAQAEG